MSEKRVVDIIAENQANYAVRMKRCLLRDEADRLVPSKGFVFLQAALLVVQIASLMAESSQCLPPFWMWVCLGSQTCIFAMTISSFYYQNVGSCVGRCALGMLKTFENNEYKDPDEMNNDLMVICAHMEVSTNTLMISYSYLDGWRRKASMAGGVLSVAFMAVSFFVIEDYTVSAMACMTFGYFAFKALYIIIRGSYKLSL